MKCDEPEEDWPYDTDSQLSWVPKREELPELVVDWEPREPVGTLWLPDETYVEVFEDAPPFGFGRYLWENGLD